MVSKPLVTILGGNEVGKTSLGRHIAQALCLTYGDSSNIVLSDYLKTQNKVSVPPKTPEFRKTLWEHGEKMREQNPLALYEGLCSLQADIHIGYRSKEEMEAAVENSRLTILILREGVPWPEGYSYSDVVLAAKKGDCRVTTIINSFKPSFEYVPNHNFFRKGVAASLAALGDRFDDE